MFKIKESLKLNISKDSLLYFADEPRLHDNLIGQFYDLKNVFVVPLRNFRIEQIRTFLVSHRNCIVVFFISNSKGSAMSLFYKICNCSFSLPYVIAIFEHEIQRLINHVKVHDSFKIFCMDSVSYRDDLVIDWIKKVFSSLEFSVIFPRYKSYLFSSTRFTIVRFLKKVEMFSYLTGYKYIVDAIELYVDNPYFYITKDIYRILANRYKTSTMNIDRCMRHAIESVWRNLQLKQLVKNSCIEGLDCDKKPSVFEFIRYASDKIINKNEYESDYDKKIS